jgi:hypothetical protein
VDVPFFASVTHQTEETIEPTADSDFVRYDPDATEVHSHLVLVLTTGIASLKERLINSIWFGLLRTTLRA